ncbi:MAG TPA: LuxR C-terminal-related transcriptional regulator [Polyangiales bacterium]|nr:LuxR C-terminal-related transcriptional regulator [Polyangiales bacterium]
MSAREDRGHPARLLADTLTSLKRLGITERAVLDEILRSALETHAAFLGFWSVWEPNALDGRDHEFVNQRGHDATGRYIPFWNRGGGAIAVEPNVFYETPGVGEFYLRPRREGRETIIEPYEYPVAGERRLIATQVAPIFYAGRCVGAAGFDLAVEDVPRAAGEEFDNPLEDRFGCGFIFLRGAATERVGYCSSRSRQLLNRYVGPFVGRELPLRLRRTFELRESAAFSFRAEHSELIVRRFDHALTGPGLLLLERVHASNARLSARESEVYAWLRQGKTNGEIATILGISLHTVKRHVEKVLHKLDVPNRSAAACVEGGLGPSTYSEAADARLACSA